ncbi:MAG: winged helix-turn-helix transcriptional regulator [Candidatus Bathyarchaeota archaeon]|nr:MAG: winged helix-turn-helix transcriptional regulator [Candidatus Bathyarchaeota archaeon]
MRLKLQLVRNGEVLFEVPLSPTDWSREQLEGELDAFESDCQRLSKIFDALSHETRLRMMKRLMEEEDRTMNFADFMRDLSLNPKTVWENARKLTEGGFLEKIERGKYRCSEAGQSGFILMSLVLRHLMEALEETETFF